MEEVFEEDQSSWWAVEPTMMMMMMMMMMIRMMMISYAIASIVKLEDRVPHETLFSCSPI
jgi:hypothetical protein